VFYDDAGSIGRRYRRQDEIGTKICVTIDYESLKNNDVTMRYIDTMKQIRVRIDELDLKLNEFLKGKSLDKLGKYIS